VPELRTGEQALGVLTFSAKAFLRLTPVAFGVGVICGTLAMAYACCGAIIGSAPQGFLFAYTMAVAAICSLTSFAALPLAAYLLFLLYWLLLDLCRAILSLPAQRDEL
jgi:hypothetical protein